MITLDLRVRHYSTEGQTAGRGDEAAFRHVERDIEIPSTQAALVLVDVWHDHYIASHIDRALWIIRNRMVPAITAARRAGMVIVHAPSPPVAEQYPHVRRPSLSGGAPPMELASWPPSDFVRREGAYAAFKRPEGPVMEAAYRRAERYRIHPLVEPEETDWLVVSGDELHALCRERGLLHLVYAGFAANMCIPFRDYGIRAMRKRGYHCILLRDSTTAIEGHDTVAELRATKQAIRELEITDTAVTTSSDHFIRACRG